MFVPPPAEEPDPQKDRIQEIVAYAAKRLQDGTPTAEVRQELLHLGLDQNQANQVLNALGEAMLPDPATAFRMSRADREAVREAGRKNMTYGALWCIGGLLVTFLSMASAEGGGRYVIAWGAVIFGGIQFFRGLSQMSGD